MSSLHLRCKQGIMRAAGWSCTVVLAVSVDKADMTWHVAALPCVAGRRGGGSSLTAVQMHCKS